MSSADNDFPYLTESEFLEFPKPQRSIREGIIAAGGNLSPGMLLSAYSQGAFPWYGEGNEILWWNPDPRFILYTDRLHISKRMKRTLDSCKFIVKSDTCFEKVINSCSSIKRSHEDGTWIHPEMIEAYTELHRLGWAHSVEVFLSTAGECPEEPVGGLYGVSIGSMFFGESMFARVSDASKAGFISLVLKLQEAGFKAIDCQVKTPHLESLGAEEIPRKTFLKLLEKSLQSDSLKGCWNLFK